MSERGSTFSHLVVVGSSAGGVGALSRLLSSLPGDLGAPVVIAQHLSPERESGLQQVLAPRSTLPVKTVVDHDPLRAGTVYVVPADRHVNITDSEVGLEVDSAGRPKPSVDLLLTSAAEVYGERLIAVILSGAGSDGAEGARTVSRTGGMVVVQDPETAEFGGMPGSVAPNVVDVVADLDQIGPIVGRVVSGELKISSGRQREVEDEDEEERRGLARFLELLRERHGVDFRSYKTPTITRRLKRRMAATGSGTLEEYTAYLEEDENEYRQLVSNFLIKVTEFFRDEEFFEHLRERVVPEMIEAARRQRRQLRVWSAGCATGEEAYSLAMMLSEALGPEAAGFDVRIFATDADEDAVNFARQGVYPPSALAPLSEEQIGANFDREGSQYRVKKQLRSMIVFGEHDLARRSPFPRMDLVVSRNVMIYFTTELQRRALKLFAYSLRDGGYLALGKAESVSPLPEFFEQVHARHRLYRRRGERFLMPPSATVSPAPPPRPNRRDGRARSDAALRVNADLQRDLRRRTHAVGEEEFLNRLPVGLVVVDRRYDILTINEAARRLLSIHGVAVGEDFLHLLRSVPYADVRSAIDASFRDGKHTITAEFGVENVATGEPAYLQMTCYPQRSERPGERQGERQGGVAETVAIVVHEVTEMARARGEVEYRLKAAQEELERSRREAEAENEKMRLQNERLIEANRELEDANRELTGLNGELQILNEESLLTTEEAQAATEEVETLNEELQATNEELETLNEELQATVEELNTTNDDLQARSSELQDLARSREEDQRAADEERRRLRAILAGMSDAVLAVGPEARVLFSNDAFTETFGDGQAGENPRLVTLGDLEVLSEEGGRLPAQETPRARAARGEEFVMRFAVRGEGGGLRRFEARTTPIGGEYGGGVIVLRETR